MATTLRAAGPSSLLCGLFGSLSDEDEDEGPFIADQYSLITLHTGLPIPDFYTPGEADPSGSEC
ncbi:hypothetical protein EYF80_036063 [Liparis tanakae]|uniref:Uncharacterized protein n=1 Tax=Liparis tanakae TaxID=230148 RepID=A0A4Z2GLQ6_9TELE|nr:hypothetical protein EYF80_036063 [Liparis tanakae]